jgi:hypothetical protein
MTFYDGNTDSVWIGVFAHLEALLITRSNGN